MRKYKYQALLPYSQAKMDCFQRKAVPNLAVRLPSWWTKFDVFCGVLNVLPPLVTYRGSYVGRYLRYDTVLRTEWACSVARHFINEARTGRLWWIPLASQKGIRGQNLTGPEPELAHDKRQNAGSQSLQTLLDFIDKP